VHSGRYILQFIHTLNAEEILYIRRMPDTFVECPMHSIAFVYFLAGILIKLERAVEETEIGPDDALINIKSMEYQKKLLHEPGVLDG